MIIHRLGGANQNWTFASVGGTKNNLPTLGPYCPDSHGIANGSQIGIFPCDGTGGHALINSGNGNALDVNNDDATFNGNVVDTWPCRGDL